MLYLMIIIVAAIAGVTRLAMQQRREQKMHLLDDFRSSLERLSNQPLPAHGRQSAGRKTASGRLPFNHKRRSESPRGEWERVAFAPHPEPVFSHSSSLADDRAESFFTPSADDVAGHVQGAAYVPVAEEVLEDEPRARKKREPILAGRLWARPREPWLWTYDKKPSRSSLKAQRREVEYVDFQAEDDLVYASEGSLAHSTYGPRSPQSSRGFAGPRVSAPNPGLDPARREAAKLRLEARRRTGSRLS